MSSFERSSMEMRWEIMACKTFYFKKSSVSPARGQPFSARSAPGPLHFSRAGVKLPANLFPEDIICYSIRRLPYIVRSVYAGFQHIGESMEEAGRSLGAGFFAVMRRITLPLLSSHIMAGAILTFAFCMFEVGSTIILAAREWDYPIAKTIYALNMRLGDGPCIASAMGVIGMLLLGSCLVAAAALLGRRLGELFRGSSS